MSWSFSKNQFRENTRSLCFLLLGEIVVVVLSGCYEPKVTSEDHQVVEQHGYSETEFAANPLLTVQFKNTVVVFLEHPQSSTSTNLTGELGKDAIPFTLQLESNAEYVLEFCFRTQTPKGHQMLLNDAQDVTLVQIQDDGNCKTHSLSSSSYVMSLIHSGKDPVAEEVLFIHRVDPAARETSTYPQLLISDDCEACDLQGINLRGQKLEKLHLSHSSLRYASLNGTSFKFSDLRNVDFKGANMRTLKSKQVQLSGADLRATRLENADFSYAFMNGVDLEGASIENALFTGAILDGATWIDARKCTETSLGQCE
ncbi:pentapeptide repeat-containing protein [Deltaproteobacteria bacterium TL4]